MSTRKKVVVSMVVIAAIGICTAIGYGIVWSGRIKKEEPAGAGVTALYHPGGTFGIDSTTIETDHGVYLVNGTVQMVKGRQLFIQTGNGGYRYLVDKEAGVSYQLQGQ